MSENKKDVKLNIDEIPAEGALGLLALGDIGVKLWRDARLKKMEENKSKLEKNEQKENQ